MKKTIKPIRFSDEQLELIKQASKLTGHTFSGFVNFAAQKQAEAVINEPKK